MNNPTLKNPKSSLEDDILYSSGLEISLIPNANKGKSYVIPEIQNYNESRFLKFTFNETMKELKICTFRTKRHLALKYTLTQVINDLYNFKYPIFSSLFFVCSCIMSLYIGILTTLSIWLIFYILLQHPDINPMAQHLLKHLFFDDRFLNK